VFTLIRVWVSDHFLYLQEHQRVHKFWPLFHTELRILPFLYNVRLHILKICMSFRAWHFLLHLYYITSYFVVFVWKNLQNKQLYNFNSSPYFLLYTFRYEWNKFITDQLRRVFVACNYKLCQITLSADGSHRTTTIFESKGAISNCI
jgi:hypothetical protein